MIPIPKPEDYGVSSQNGFLPTNAPLERLPDSYYQPWEFVVKNLQGLILSKRLRETVENLPVLSTDRLDGEAQWHRAYSTLAFIAHAYIWGGDKPAARVPPPVTIPFMAACEHLELPPVATYAGLVLWNWKPIFESESAGTLANLDMIDSFTGSLDEKWFYLISVAVEARGGAIIPTMLRAMEAIRDNDRPTVTTCLQSFAERLDELGSTLSRMYENCDPHVFYNRLRPYLAGSKNMAEAGLPNGVIFDNGGSINKQRYVQFSGGSNAQSSIIQFFDIVLGVQHRPTGVKKDTNVENGEKKSLKPDENFIYDMRKYMPGPHARFLEEVSCVANIRSFVQANSHDRALGIAFDACLAMLSAFRDTHIQLVSRYIIIKSREAKKAEPSKPGDEKKPTKINLANRTKSPGSDEKKDLTGTGGTSLIPFLRQARDETGEQAVDIWTRNLLNKKRGAAVEKRRESTTAQGLAGVWQVDNGGLCYF